ncbi:hypothetical protein ABMA27_005503 [Loxostege sticticalis]|uniref:Sodium channel protein Nach n=1 Tax=Loxostege sticticalis TaxID=481309 RepID=A0ABR3HJF0_LOXSC
MKEPRAWENRPSFKRKRDNYGRKLRKKKLIKYLLNELRTCTTHGLPYIANTEIHWLERVFWAVSFLLAVAITIALLYKQYYRFSSSPIVTSVEMDYFNWNVSYPAITLCPMYKIEDDDLKEIVNETMENTGEDIDTQLRVLTTISYDTADVVDFDSLEVSSVIKPTDYAMLAAMIFKKFDNNSLTTSTNWPVTVEAAMTEMGMCHVINSNVAQLDNPLKYITAKYAKKNIDLSVHERDFFIQLVNYADVYKVFIHSPDELIQSSTPSYTSRSSNYIYFGVKVWSTRISDRLRKYPLSVRNCRFLNEPINKRYPIYTYSHCLIECRIKMILELCGCIPHFYRRLDHEKVCNLSELPCFVEHKPEFIKLSVSDETLSNLTEARNRGKLPRAPRDCGCLSSCESDIFTKDHETFTPQEDHNSMRVGISAYPKVRIVKDTIINLYDIILRSGGVINLCIGASVISLAELLVLIIKVILHYTVIILSVIIRMCRFIIPRVRMWSMLRKKGNNNYVKVK